MNRLPLEIASYWEGERMKRNIWTATEYIGIVLFLSGAIGGVLIYFIQGGQFTTLSGISLLTATMGYILILLGALMSWESW